MSVYWLSDTYLTCSRFYIRDLDTVVELMDIMLDRNYFQNAEIFDYFLDLCAKVCSFPLIVCLILTILPAPNGVKSERTT